MFFTFLLLHILVLSNHEALRLYGCINIKPFWEVRVHYDGFSLSILLGNSYYSPGPNFCLSFLDLLKGEHNPVPENFISWFPQKEFPWCHKISFLSQDNHWVSCPDDHNIFWSNYGHSYYFIYSGFSFGILGCCKIGLGVGVFIRWDEGCKLFFLSHWWL